MMATPRTRPGGQRLFAWAAAALVVIVFVSANAHLLMVAFSSRPDCVLQPQTGDAAHLRAAKTSC